jgi:23S rRNA G2069 N7-methylase RlmK/C1962 C5-methylase RlmI
MTHQQIVPSTSAFVHDDLAGGASCVTAVDSSAEALQAGTT